MLRRYLYKCIPCIKLIDILGIIDKTNAYSTKPHYDFYQSVAYNITYLEFNDKIGNEIRNLQLSYCKFTMRIIY